MKNVPLTPSNYVCMHPFCTTYCNLKYGLPPLPPTSSIGERRSANGDRSSSFVPRRVKPGDPDLSVGGRLTADGDRRSSLLARNLGIPLCLLTYLLYLLYYLPDRKRFLGPSTTAKEKRNEHRHRHCLESRYAYLNYYKQLPCYIILP